MSYVFIPMNNGLCNNVTGDLIGSAHIQAGVQNTTQILGTSLRTYIYAGFNLLRGEASPPKVFPIVI